MIKDKKEQIMENSEFEAVLFKTADKLRKNIDAAEYKNVVLGLIFLKKSIICTIVKGNIFVLGRRNPNL